MNANESPLPAGSPVARAPLPEGGESFEALVIKQGLITPLQLQEAYLVQRRYEDDGLAYDIDEILIKKGILTQSQVAGLWARHAQEGRNTIEGYEILGKVGEGGMGAVYKARQKSMDRIVALKVLLRRHLKGEQGVERFLREARAVARLSHPHIVMGLDAGYSNGKYYYVMEFLEGEPLDQKLRRDGPLPWRTACSVVKQAASALDHAFRNGLIHRDIKPGNLFVLRDGSIKLLDLGAARFTGEGDLSVTLDGQVMGTPLYMSPEQVTGKTLDIRSDLYALGISLYEMLAGRPPFMGDHPLAVMRRHLEEPVKFLLSGVPPGLAAIGTTLTEKDPLKRYSEPADLVADLEALEEDRPLLYARIPGRPRPHRATPPTGLRASNPSPTQRPGSPVPPHPKVSRPLRMIGVGAAAVVVVLAIFWKSWIDGSSKIPAAVGQPRPTHSPAKALSAPLEKSATTAGPSLYAEELRNLDEKTRRHFDHEEFQEAAHLVEEARNRHPEGDWQGALEARRLEVEARARRTAALLREKAVEAKRRGEGPEVQRLRDLIAGWGYPRLLEGFDAALGEATSQTETGSGSQRPSLPVYRGGLEPGWVNWSWDSQVDLKATKGVLEGSRSVAFTPKKPFAGLYFHRQDPVDTTRFLYLSFSLCPMHDDLHVGVTVWSQNQKGSTTVGLDQLGGVPRAREWKTYIAPVSRFTPADPKVHSVMFQTIGASEDAIFYVTDIAFLAEPPAASSGSK